MSEEEASGAEDISENQGDAIVDQVDLPESTEWEDEDEKVRQRDLADYSYQVFVLSEYGRPVFVTSGCEERISDVFALMSTFVNKVKEWGDSVVSFSSGDVHVHFLLEAPLCLCIVSKRHEWLEDQLRLTYEQIVSTISKTQLESIYEKKGHTYDLRRLLKGTQAYTVGCVKAYRAETAVMLSALRVFPLPASERELLSSALCQAAAAAKLDELIFGLVISHRQLVTYVRRKMARQLHQRDVHVLSNIVANNAGLRNGQNWMPICLPMFSNKGFVHVYMSYPWEGIDATVVLISLKRDHFFALSDLCSDFVSRLSAHPNFLPSFQAAVQRPSMFDLSVLGPAGGVLWHLVYKRSRCHQLCLSAVRPPFISRSERIFLFHTVASAAFLIRNSASSRHSPEPQYKAADGKNLPHLRTAFIRRTADALYISITDSYELICVFSPVVSPTQAAAIAEKAARELKRSESNYFISHSPTF